MLYGMKKLKCALCGGEMKRNGFTKAGKQRWRCKVCDASTTYRYDAQNSEFEAFLNWLFGKTTQKNQRIEDRSFRRKIAPYWNYWPLPPIHEQPETAIHVDGIYLARNVVILIASSQDGVIGWYLARGESSHAWIALLRRIREPELVVTDGGTGFEKAKKALWPQVKVQRCLYHVFCQIKRLTTTRPKLPAGQELYRLVLDLLNIHTLAEAKIWTLRYLDWGKRWNSFLCEKTYNERGHWAYTHKHLHRARSGLNKLLAQNVLFTYLENSGYPSTNNRIEGGINARLREVLYNHRGMPLIHRIKAVFWWCYTHCPQTVKTGDVLLTMPTDKQIVAIYRQMATNEKTFGEISNWGDAVVWSELHRSAGFFNAWD